MDRRFSDREVSELLLRVCHDFGSPLRAIHIHSELLRKTGATAGGPEVDQHLEFILKAAKDADLLRRGLVNYSIALQVEPRSFRSAPLEVLVRNVLYKLQKELAANEAEVTVDRMPTVAGDQDRLMEVFEQLLRNALVHRGAAQPRIHISSEEKDGGWLVSVRDNGPGVDSRDLDTMFRPFQRLHSEDRPGPGLGLAICRAILERHGGTIWAESQAGGGCRICFTLPA